MRQFTLPHKLESLANKREHWSVKSRRAKKQRADAYMVCPQFPVPCVVTITRVAPRPLDDDNLAISAKHVRDGIADRLGINDGGTDVEWKYKQVRGAVKTYEVRVMLELPAEYENRMQRAVYELARASRHL